MLFVNLLPLGVILGSFQLFHVSVSPSGSLKLLWVLGVLDNQSLCMYPQLSELFN